MGTLSTIERLESRLHLASTLIPVTNYNDLAFDDTRNRLYISTDDGKIQRWDVATGTLLGAWTLGTKEYGIDISPDGKWLYAAESAAGTGTGTGTIHKVDLDTGAVTNLTYTHAYSEAYPWELVVLSDGKVYFSAVDSGSGWMPVHIYDPASDTFSTMGSYASGLGHGPALTRNASGKRMFIAEVNSSGGGFHLYDAPSASFAVHSSSGWYNNGTTGVSRLGEHYANDAGNLTVYRVGGLEPAKTFTHDGGMLFSPTVEAAYMVDLTNKRIDVVQLGTWTVLGSMPVDETPQSYYEFSNGEMAGSSSGRYLYLGTPSGVRQYDMSTLAIPLSVEGGSYTVAEGDSIRLNAYGVNRLDRAITNYEWDLDYNGTFSADVSGISAWTTMYSAATADGPATRTAAVRVTDNQGNTAIDLVTINITNKAPVLTVAGADNTATETSYAITFSATDTGTDTISGWTIDWGDGSPVDTLPGTAPGASHIYTDGSYRRTITVSATDEDGTYSITKSVLVRGHNDAPTISSANLTSSSSSFNEGTTITFSGSFADPDTADTHTVTIQWGDGSANTILNLAEGVTTFSTTHKYLDDNPAGTSEDDNTIVVTVSDGSLSASASKTVHVINVAPTFTLSSSYNLSETTWQINPSAVDTDSVLTKRWLLLNSGGVTVAEGTTTDTYITIPIREQGTYTLDLTVSDDDGGSTRKTATLNVSNTAPTITLTGATTTQVGQAYSLGVSTSDPGDDTITASYINWGDGVIENFVGTPGNRTHTYTDGSYRRTITVGVTDEDGSYTNTKSVLVQGNNDAPAITADGLTLSATALNEAQTLTLGGTFTDPDTADTHTVTIDWGDGSAVTTFSLNEGVLTFSGKTHTYADDNPTGTGQDIYTIKVTVADASTSAFATRDLTINNVAPTVNGGVDRTINEGQSVSFTTTVSDVGTKDTLTRSWVLTDAQGNTIATGTDPAFSRLFPDNGIFTYTMTVTDDDGGVGTDSVVITVNNVAPTLTLTGASTIMAGTPYTLTMAASDPGADTITSWTINWGDGVIDTLVGNPGSATHAYADGRHWRTISAAATDEDGTYNKAMTIMVDGINDPPSIVNLTTNTSQIGEGSSITLSGTIADPDTVGGHTLLINWGDGSTNTTVNLAEGALQFAAVAHTYADNPGTSAQGDYTITVTVTDDGGLTAQGTKSITVTNLPPNISASTSLTDNEGSLHALNGSATDPGNDPFTLRWTIKDSGGNLVFQTSGARTNSSNSYNISYGFPDNGVYTVLYEAIDEDGAIGKAEFTVTINNVAPTLTAAGPASIYAGQPYTLALSSSDPGQDTIQYWTINWGDGNTQRVDGNPSSVQHTYGAGGTYTISGSATDEDGTFSIPAPSSAVAIDTTFGSSGYATFSNANLSAQNAYHADGAVALLPDGKVLAAVRDTANRPLQVRRYNANGSLDTTFGSGGIVTSAPFGIITTPQAIAVLSDGRFLVLATAGNNSYVVRYNANGAVDTTFASSGGLTLSYWAYDVKAFADGSFILGGVNYSDAMVLARYTASGAPDTTFGTSGVASVRVGVGVNNWDCAYSLAVQSDGKIVAAGQFGLTSSTSAGRTMGIARFLANGQLDAGFGTGGTIRQAFLGTATAESVIVQPDGKIVATGYTYTSSGAQWVTVRYTASGQLDTTFSGDGYDITSVAYAGASAHDVMIQPDGRLIVSGGMYYTNNGWNLAFLRYNPDGSYDSSFDGDGLYIMSSWSSSFEEAMATVRQPDGNLMVLGGYNSDVRLLRLKVPSPRTVTVIGAVATFSLSGPSTATAGSPYILNASVSYSMPVTISSYVVDWGDGVKETLTSLPPVLVHVYADGTHRRSIVLTVNSEIGAASSDPFRILVTGVNDAPSVVSLTPTPNPSDEGGSVTLNGQISDPDTADTHSVLVDWGDGTTQTLGLGEGETLFTASHTYKDNPAGQPNGSYPARVTVSDGSLSGSQTTLVTVRNVVPVANAGATQYAREGGSLTLTGTWTDVGSLDTVTGTWVIRNAAGTLIASGAGNAITCTFPDDGLYTGYYTATDKDGGANTGTVAIYVSDVPPVLAGTGAASVAEGQPYTLNLSVTDPGTDTVSSWTINWGDGAIQTIPGNPPSVQHIYADGLNSYNISFTATNEDGAFRGGSTTYGAVDSSFGTNGQVNSGLSIYSSSSEHIVATQADGKVIAVGEIAQTGWLVKRFLANGQLDTTFGTNGSVSTTLTNWSCTPHSVAVQSDGKILVVGDQGSIGKYHEVVLVRYNTNGSLDSTFGSGGIVSTYVYDSYTGSNSVAGIAVRPNGKIVVAGSADGWPAWFLVQYNTNGTLDTTFASNGIMWAHDLGAYSAAFAGNMILQSDGSILFGGWLQADTGEDIAGVARFTSAGVLDTTYGTGGVAVPAVNTMQYPKDMAILPNGDALVIGGELGEYGVTKPVVWYLMALKPNGTLDTAFGAGGLLTVADPGLGGLSSSSLVVTSAGRIIVASAMQSGAALKAFLPDGSVDLDFGVGGSLTFTPTGNNPGAPAVAIGSNNQLFVLAGSNTATLSAYSLQPHLVTVTITNVAPILNLPATAYAPLGAPMALAAALTDPGTDPWTATVDYGDGTGVQALTINADRSFVLNHAYATAGTYTAVITVDDHGGGTASGSIAITAIAAPQVLSWSSVLTHGAVGPVGLLIPDTGAFREPRNGGIRRLLVDFDQDLLASSIAPADVLLSGNNADGLVNLSGIAITTTLVGTRQLQIDFSAALPDVAVYRITLAGIKGLASADLSGDRDRVLAALKGDANGDGQVSTGDQSFVKANLTTRIDPTNTNQVRSDVANDGRVTATDQSMVKANIGHRTRTIVAPASSYLTGRTLVQVFASSALLSRNQVNLLSNPVNILG